jgi:hexosaminidase
VRFTNKRLVVKWHISRRIASASFTSLLLAGCMVGAVSASAQIAPASSVGCAADRTGFVNTLMPEPSSLEVESGCFQLDTSITVGFTAGHDTMLEAATARALTQLENITGLTLNKSFAADPATASFQIQVDHPGNAIQSLDDDESYNLSVRQGRIILQAPNDLGAMHGLQTLLQLVQQEPTGYVIPAVAIADTPRFRWRGLMIDVGRHFQPVPVILRTLDGMAAVKLNVFHWHLTDDQGFRVESLRFPKLHIMGSDGLYYTQSQIRDVVAYAHARGIRVVPEFDIPGHATSWFVGYPELASGPGPYQVEHTFGIKDAAMDPTRESTYKFLDAFIGEMSTLFPDAYMHIGGDENKGKQWMANPAIRSFMQAHQIENPAGLQVYFNKRLLAILTKYHKRMMGWDEILTPGLPDDIVVQSWRGVQSLNQGAKGGYQGILSAPYYLDAMLDTATHYLADPIPADSDLTSEQKKLILGGEVCMWGEQISAETIDSRMWPRTTAIAERFWSPASVRNVDDMYRRLQVMSLRLDGIGIQHISEPQRMQRQIAGKIASPEFSVLTSVLEPVSFHERGHLQHPDQLIPLNGLVDALVPDPPSGHDVAREVTEFLEDTATHERQRCDLEKLFRDWEETAPRLSVLMHSSPRLMGDSVRAQQLAELGTIGTEAMLYLETPSALPPGWRDSKLAEIAAIEEQKSLVRFTILDPLKQLVQAAGSESIQPSQSH